MSQGLFDRDVERRLRLLEAVATFTILDARYVAVPTAWTAVTFTNSWVNYDAGVQVCQYRKIGDVVHLRGAMKTGTVALAAFTLPAGFRPPADLSFVTTSNGAFGQMNISTAGVYNPILGNNTIFHITCSFSTVS